MVYHISSCSQVLYWDCALKIPNVEYFLSEVYSQDPLKFYFSRQQHHGGSNDNPTAEQVQLNAMMLIQQQAVHRDLKTMYVQTTMKMASPTRSYSFWVSSYDCLARLQNAAVSCVNQRERFTQYWARPSEERRKKKKKERRKKNIWPVLRVPGLVLSRCFLVPLWVLLVIKTLEDEWYVVIKAYKLTFFEILRDFFVLSYIACPRYPYIRVYRLYDKSVIPIKTITIPYLLKQNSRLLW